MDHRCLYGHRVPAAFTFAIQSRSCPTCGAHTVTITGYQAARKLTVEAGLDAVGAFNVIRVIEGEYVLTPVAGEAAATAPAAGLALGAVDTAPGAPTPEEEEVVVEDVEAVAAPSAMSAPEPRLSRPAREKAEGESRKDSGRSRAEPRVGTPAPVMPVARASAARTKEGFDADDEDFFKGA